MSVEEVPRQLGSYRIIAKLGAGGMANVYLGMQSGMAKFKKLVVVKVLHPNHVANVEFLNMFLNEARLAARLNHPNVVNTYEVGEDDGRHFMAMEYLEGQPFNAVSRRSGGTRSLAITC
jgi:serine/threonine-protein kinase